MPILLIAFGLGLIPGLVTTQVVNGGLTAVEEELRRRKRWWHF